MFDLGWPELLVIAIVLIVVVGPKDLPRVLRSFGRTTTKLRSMAGDFRKQFDEALREAELDEVKGLADEARKLDPRREIRKHLDPLDKAGREIRSGLDEAAKPKAAATPADAATKPTPAAPAKTGAKAVAGNGAAGAAPAKPAPAKKAAKPAAAKKAAAAKPASASKSTAKRAAPKPATRNKKTTGTAS